MRLIRFGVPVLVAFAVLANGAVQPWSEAVLEIGAGLLLVIWALHVATRERFELRWNPLLIPVAGLLARYRHVWSLVDATVAASDLDAICVREDEEANPDLRWVLVHFVEETARHAGHADVLRELVDACLQQAAAFLTEAQFLCHADSPVGRGSTKNGPPSRRDGGPD